MEKEQNNKIIQEIEIFHLTEPRSKEKVNDVRKQEKEYTATRKEITPIDPRHIKQKIEALLKKVENTRNREGVLAQCQRQAMKSGLSAGIWDSDFIVAAQDPSSKDIIGYAALHKGLGRRPETDLHAFIITIDPEYQGNGIGKIIYDYVEEHSKGLETISAHMDNQNSMDFHKHLGFTQEDGRERNCIKQIDQEKAIHSYKEIPDFQIRTIPTKHKTIEREVT
ncbi:MAG: GNAT family N-acetyltransferase [Firmicutes bacterium]|nr:GNAT family N-acetyltransferase [Bacillota bacterium]